MRNEFPLLDSLILTGELSPLPPQVKLIEAQQATDKYWLDENDVWELKKDFGSFAPPYPYMWVESTAHVPTGEPVNGKIANETWDTRMGFKMECLSADEFMATRKWAHRRGMKPFKWAHTFQVFTDNIIYSKEGRRCVPAAGHLTVDENGAMVEYWATIEKDFAPTADRKMLNTAVWGNGKAALYAISLMNCRNVELVAGKTVERGGKKSRRKRAPSVEYHTIKLPAPKTSGGGSGQLTGATKLHTARGHFKTYTEDAPLMGRHVGTYYWGWQVRGNRKNGEIISSYQVA